MSIKPRKYKYDKLLATLIIISTPLFMFWLGFQVGKTSMMDSEIAGIYLNETYENKFHEELKVTPLRIKNGWVTYETGEYGEQSTGVESFKRTFKRNKVTK